MRRILFVVSILTTSWVSQSAGTAFADASLELSTALRTDSFRWNIAGDINGQTPNVLSELTWKDLKISELRLKGRATYNGVVYLRGDLGHGSIYSGAVQDSDYAGDGRTLESSRTNNSSDDGSVWDASFGAGFRSALLSGKPGLDVIPMLGYSYRAQDLKITNGLSTIPPTGPFPGLDSTYQARWQGPWVGIDLVYVLRRLTLNASIEYHRAVYRAQADWNLRTDFVHPKSFEHKAGGDGAELNLSAAYALSKRWSLKAGLDLRKWRAVNGTDTTFFVDGTSAVTHLNEAEWNSTAFSAGVSYAF